MESGNFYRRPFAVEPEQREQDFRLLHTLSNFQVPQDPQGNLQWQHNRRHYDETTGTRRHYIAHEQATQEPIAYAAIEHQVAHPVPHQEQSPSVFRLFLVFNPHRWSFATLGEFLYQRLLEDAHQLGATKLVLVEYATDQAFLAFLKERGFVEIGRGVFNEFAIVRVEKQLSE